MLIDCPYCGRRGNDEFAYRGDATVRRPAIGISEKEEAGVSPAWMDYVYLRDNPAGRHRELWYHATGCRAWLIVTRDVTTHEILGVEPAKPASAVAEVKDS
jgi:heterotetrameric sarcosine oxidase delta subunit